jgi:uncharacterized protein
LLVNVTALSADLPIVVEIINSKGSIERCRPLLDPMTQGGLVSLEQVRILRYDANPGAAGQSG